MSRSLRVLIVEDVDDDAVLVARELERGGFIPDWRRVESAAELEAALDEGGWDIILSDYALPGFTGRDALEIVLRRGLDIPFIVISGTSGEKTAVEMMRAGAHDFFLKDQLGLLVPAVERELREAGERKARRKAEVSLEESRRMLSLILDSIPQRVFWKDRESRYLGCNRPFAEDAGVGGPDHIVGKTDDDLAWCNTADRYRADDRTVMEADEPMLAYDEPVVVADGSPRWVRTSKLPLHDAEGCVVGVLGTYEDITERRELERQLMQAQKLESVGRLAGGVAHDFNNLLTVIFGHVDFLISQLHPDDPARAGVDEIRHAAERAAELTRGLLAYSRRQVLEPVVLDLNQVIGGLESMLRRLIGEDVEMQIRLADGLGRIEADLSQLEQVIVNLVVNARDAMPTGGRLTIETADVVLDEAFAADHAGARLGPHVALTVSDTGHGMEAEVLERIYEPFFTTKDVEKGTGLGLSMVYGIVKQSGGSIWCDSELDKGSTFTIYLPRVEAEAEAPPSPERSAASAGDEVVLIAEDEPRVRELMAAMLKPVGYTVLTAAGGAEALAIARAHDGPIDLLISDLVMPRMSGRELAGRIVDLYPDIGLLFTSGYSEDAANSDGRMIRGAAFLQKPFSREDLITAVRELLDRRREPAKPSLDSPA